MLKKVAGLDEAIIGIGSGCKEKDRIIYDVDKVIWILMQRDGMTDAEAEEFFLHKFICSSDIGGTWHGEETPIWMRPYDIEGDD